MNILILNGVDEGKNIEGAKIGIVLSGSTKKVD